MSGDKCCYFNCGKSRRNYKNLQFHVFPTDVKYSRMWILFSGNSSLNDLSPKRLRRRYICSDHFDDSMYINPNAEKRRLIQRAVPIKYMTQPIEQLNEAAQFSEILTTPVKQHTATSSQLRGTIFNFKTEDNELDSTSPKMLKMLTPKEHKPASIDILHHENAASSVFSPTLSVRPDTQKYIIDLSKLLPSSEKSNITPLMNVSLSLQLKNEYLENRCKKLQKILQKKKAIIRFLEKLNYILER